MCSSVAERPRGEWGGREQGVGGVGGATAVTVTSRSGTSDLTKIEKKRKNPEIYVDGFKRGAVYS